MAKSDRSLGGLRTNPNHINNPKSPDGLGRILFNRDTIQQLYEELQQTGNSKVEAKLACWNNVKTVGKREVDRFLTIEVQALSLSDRHWWEAEKPSVTSLEEFFN